MRKCLVLLLCLCLILTTGCSAEQAKEYGKYSAVFYEAFDTETTVIGYTADQETFDRVFRTVRDRFFRLHEVFDAYNTYAEVHNLCYVNAHAAAAPTPAEPELLELLLWMKQLQPRLNGCVNIAMGAVLALWHDAREAGVSLPSQEELLARSAHVNFDDVIIDEEDGTVFFADPELCLDLGAVAKGYAVERIAEELLEKREMPSFIISAGGNVRCGEPPLDGRDFWGVGIQDPDSSFNKEVLYLAGASVVTSGDYQRYYMVDGVRYHHLIDPVTLYPGTHMRSLTIVTEDSGYADALSTAVFLLPFEEGYAFVESLEGVEAMWILNDATVRTTEGLKSMMLSAGATPYQH